MHRKDVIFFGSDGIALRLLEFLVHSDTLRLSGIVSKPDMPSGRGHRVEETEVSRFARTNGIPLLTPRRPDEATAAWMRSVGCDLVLVMAYGHILGKNILEVPPLGIYNFHASMLPKYRGASPIETAIACGETETGVSLMRIVEEMDAGAVADVERVPIGCDDTYRQISEKISGACPVMLGRNLDALCSGTLHLSEQSHANATFTRKLSKSDGLLDFSLPAEALKNRIRALTPHIGCVLEYDGISLKIGAASAHSNRCEDFRSGQIVAVESDAISVATADGLLLIGELQRPGGRMLKIKDFINGFPIEPGKILPSHPSRELVSVSPFNKFHK